MKLNSQIELFLADVCAGKTNETEQTYRTKLRQLERYAKSKPITADLLKGFIHDLKTRKTHISGHKAVEGGLSLYTIKTIIQTTRHFCKWSYENGHMREELYKQVKVPSVPAPMPKAIHEDTFGLLIKSAQNNISVEWERARDIAMLYFLRDTGGRVGGMTNTMLPNIDLKSGEIETIEKGQHVKLYLNEPTIEAIKIWLTFRPQLEPITDHLFTANRSARGLTRGGVRWILNKLSARAGITDRHNPHAFRHAFARDFLKAGGEITQLAGLFHHSSIWVTTNYYARWNDKELRSAHAAHSPINQTVEKISC